MEQLAQQRQKAEAELGKRQAERAALGGGDQEHELAVLQSQIDGTAQISLLIAVVLRNNAATASRLRIM